MAWVVIYSTVADYHRTITEKVDTLKELKSILKNVKVMMEKDFLLDFEVHEISKTLTEEEIKNLMGDEKDG